MDVDRRDRLLLIIEKFLPVPCEGEPEDEYDLDVLPYDMQMEGRMRMLQLLETEESFSIG